MLFEGRPELVLPPAPETRLQQLLRWISAFFASATFVLSAGLVGLAATFGEPYWSLLPALCVPALATFASLQFYFSRRQRDNEAYWQPARVRQRLPHIWQLYCAGNGTLVRPLDRRRVR